MVKRCVVVLPVFVVCLCIGEGLCGEVGKTYDLFALEKLVLEKDPGVKSAEARLKFAFSQLYEAKADLGPEFIANYTYYPTGGGVTQGEFDTQYRLDLQLRQDVVELMKTKPQKVREMQAELESAQVELAQAQKKVLYDVRMEYFELLQEKIFAESYNRLKEAYEDLLGLMKKRYREKEILLSDYLPTQTSFMESKELFLNHQRNFERKRKRLAELAGLEPEQIEVHEVLFRFPIPSEDLLIASAMQNRYELGLYRARATQENARALAGRYEEIVLRPYIGYLIRDDRTTGLETGPYIGVYFRVPFGIATLRRERFKKHQALEQYWNFALERALQDIRREIATTYEDYTRASAKLLTTEKALELVTEQIRVEQAKLSDNLRTVQGDPLLLQKLRIQRIVLAREKRLAQMEILKTFYELLFLAGLSYPGQLFALQMKGVYPRKAFPRALWVWSTEELITDHYKETFFISFCQAKGVKRVFLGMNKKLLEAVFEQPRLPKLITKLDQLGISVSALLGENLWIYPDHRKNLIDRLHRIIAYNTVQPLSARFDAVHLDIEPQALQEWSKNARRLLKLLLKTYEASGDYLHKNAPELKLEVDIPVFFDRIEPSSEKSILELSDLVVLMAYRRKNPLNLALTVESLLKSADVLGKDVLVGLNAKDFEKEVELETLIGEAGKRLSSHSSFAGFAVHDFKDYHQLAGR